MSRDMLVTLSEIAEIELFIVRRMKEFTPGEHASVFKGGGFNFVGTRDWQPGDRMASIDWAQSSLTNFSPLVSREFEQDSTATIVAVADASLSTRCGIDGMTIATAIARGVAAVGLSATFFQDMFGFVAFDEALAPVTTARPRIGRPHVLYCLDLYGTAAAARAQADDGVVPRRGSSPGVTAAIESQLRRSAMVPVISDFLFPEAPALIRELTLLNAVHDVFLLMADARFAYEVPGVSAGWVEVFDVESQQTRVLSRREVRRLAERVDAWQQDIMAMARAADLDVLRVGLDRWEMETSLAAFTAERRLRKI